MNPKAPEFKPFKDLMDLDDSESVSSNSTARGNTSLLMTFRAKLSSDLGMSNPWKYQTALIKLGWNVHEKFWFDLTTAF